MQESWKQKPDYDPTDKLSPNYHSALSGSEFAPELEDIDIERDEHVRNNILRTLSMSHVNTDGLDISVKEGFVSLTGVVESQAFLDRLETQIRSVDGVIDVASLVRIREAGDSGVPSPS